MTWIQTASGRAVDLIAPKASDIDFEVDVAPALARIARFTGHVPAGPYSVAQHCVIGADAIMRDTGDRQLAAAFLLHDAHEAYIGDPSRPWQLAIVEYIKAATDGSSSAHLVELAFKEGQRRMKHTLDAAIHTAAGVPYPYSLAMRTHVRTWDERMLETERRLFLASCPDPWGWDANPPNIIRWPDKARVWPWPEAADRYLAALRHYCPAALSRAA